MKIKQILKAPLILVLFPLDYIGWALIMSPKHGAVTVKRSWNKCWKSLMHENKEDGEIGV